MGRSLTRKLLEAHLAKGALHADEENEFRVDQVLLQDATGTMAFLQYEQLGLERIRVPFAIVYVDHNMLQIDYRNPDDHRFLLTFAQKHGIHYSRPGNGICHQVHLERFAQPGTLLVGADSHTPMAGAVGGMVGIGAGGLDAAVLLAGFPFTLVTPKVVRVELRGRLRPWVASKDIILELLRRYTVKGGLGKIYEFVGEGVATLSVTQRAPSPITLSSKKTSNSLRAPRSGAAGLLLPGRTTAKDRAASTLLWHRCFSASGRCWPNRLRGFIAVT